MRTIKETRWGKMAFEATDRWIGESLLHYGEYAPDETRHLLMFVDETSVVLDIGANIGALTLPFARHARHVWAFEPQRPVFALLEETVALNGLTNVTCRQQGVGDAPGRMRIKPVQWHEDKHVNSGGITLEENVDGDDIGIVTVDSLPLADCGLMKIDVEGFELNVLKGAVQTIEKYQPVIYAEADHDQHTPDMIALMRTYGYVPYWDATRLFSEKNFAGNPHNIFGKARSINMLCLPASRPLPDALKHLLPATDGDTLRKVSDRI